MKALLLDEMTTRIISMVSSQTEILKEDVCLVERLGKEHPSIGHLKAVLLLQPTSQNIDLLLNELRDPKFSEYHIFFTNILSVELLTKLGKADEHDLVKQVQEYYCDFLAINEDFFHLGADNSLSLSSTSRNLQTSLLFDRNVNGLLSVLLAMKKRPSQIRFQGASSLAQRIAEDVVLKIERDPVYDFRRTEGPLLLILDRRDDPVTPLLTQWTYQAMVHELLGLNNNRVLLRGAPNVPKDMEEVVLSPSQDSFFSQNRYSNFGDLGLNAKSLLQRYQQDAKLNENMSSIEDMQRFVERYPAFKSQSINVSKHLTLISEMSRLITQCSLFDVSSLEQSIACSNEHSEHQRELFEKLDDRRIERADKLRLSLLYALKYESYNEVPEIKRILERNGLEARQLSLFDSLLSFSGETHRAPGLFTFGEKGVTGFITKVIRSTHTALNGVDNVYTQHQPLLSYILESFAKGRTRESDFPLAGGTASSRFSEVVVFMVGGATYEEAAKVAEYNATNSGMRVILGGSCIHNSTSFLREVSQNFGR